VDQRVRRSVRAGVRGLQDAEADAQVERRVVPRGGAAQRGRVAPGIRAAPTRAGAYTHTAITSPFGGGYVVLGGLRWLDYGNPIVSKAVLTTAIPSMPMVIMLAVKCRAAEAEIVSAVFLSVIGSGITMGAFIALTS